MRVRRIAHIYSKKSKSEKSAIIAEVRNALNFEFAQRTIQSWLTGVTQPSDSRALAVLAYVLDHADEAIALMDYIEIEQ